MKTILGVALIEGVMLMVLVFSALGLLRSSNEDQLTNRGYTAARVMAATANNAILAHDLASLERFVEKLLKNPNVVYVRVWDDKQVLLQGGDPAALARPFVADKTYADSERDGVFDAYADLTNARGRYGRVELGISNESVRRMLVHAKGTMFSIALLEMVLVGLFSFILGIYLTRNLAKLARASERLADGELGYQIAARGHDEIARTAGAFNAMSLRLKALDRIRKEADEALRRLNEDLERRVRIRTEELATVNQELQHQALHDPLTKLPNRRLLFDRLQQAILLSQREGKKFALAVLDLDRFKEVNDTLGHDAGDLLLQEAANRLKTVLRKSDTVARLGGDEFALLLPNMFDVAAAQETARKILQALAASFTVLDHPVEMRASVGIVLFPDDGADAALLLRRADMAMYGAKRARSGFALYRPELDHFSAERLALPGELRSAIENNELILHYQPIVDVRNGSVWGVEALVRWNHPSRGLLFPNAFIPLAEETDLIQPLTLWVVTEALRQRGCWQQAGFDLHVSVNISAANLQDDALPEQIRTIIATSGVAPDALDLEITETAIMVEPERALAAIVRLSDVGVGISIDDFGTGYSSMTYLKKTAVGQDQNRSILRHRYAA